MANVQVSLTQLWACFCDTGSSAGLVNGPETAEYNNSIYIYAEAATPADAIQGVVNAGRVPDDESFERMIQQVTDFYEGGTEDASTVNDLISAIEDIQANPVPKN